jgi:anti-sigma regulatory factor (Ser/Thr protein kinase)
MRLHHHIAHQSRDFQATDDRLTALMRSWAGWLEDDECRRLRLGLHELLVNIRNHAYQGSTGPIDVLFTASAGVFRIDVTDAGATFEGPVARALPEDLAEGGYGLPIVTEVFDEVVHVRLDGRNWWALEVHRKDGGAV